MVTCVCIVQAGQAPDRNKSELIAALEDFSSRSFGERADVSWMPVSEGNGFTAYSSSTSSVVSFTVNAALEQSARVALLTELSTLWIDGTGCSSDELVAVINDPQQNQA